MVAGGGCFNKERMMEICEEVWDAIPIEDLRCYFQKLPKTWDEIHKQKRPMHRT